MHFLFESLFVGIYTSIIYIFFSLIQIKNIYITFFVVGFIKHFLGYYSQIHTYYCNNGYSCKGNNKKISVTTKFNLFIESLFEGILFLILGSIISQVAYFSKNKILLFFSIGFILHLLFELLGIHKKFCLERCKIKNI